METPIENKKNGQIPLVLRLRLPAAIFFYYTKESKMSSPELPHDATEFRVDLSLAGMEKCKSLTIPEIKVNKNEVPTETKQLYIILEDTNIHNFPHGTKLIPYEDFNGVLQESFKIVPLCPPGGSHQYRLTVHALDKENKIIGYGQATQQFP